MYSRDLTHTSPTLQHKLSQLYQLNRGRTGLCLAFRSAYLNLLERLGAPHRRLPPCVHIAGTNGKGSTLAVLTGVMEAADLTVHRYTSPHLITFNERIYLAGRDIDDAVLEPFIDEALHAAGDTTLSFFEVTTALAFAAFARHTADVVLLETGLGGRLDCTNVLRAPAVTVITRIGLDHQAELGDSLAEIAYEKAGILKPGKPCIVAPQEPGALTIIEARAWAIGARLYKAGKEWDVHQGEQPGRLAFRWRDTHYSLPVPALTGAHQVINAGTALAAFCLLCEEEGLRVTKAHLSAGLQKCTWPARLQRITARIPDCPDGWDIWLDGGHNIDAAYALRDHIAQWKQEKPDRPVHLICGMMPHKRPEPFLEILTPCISSLTLIPVDGHTDSAKHSLNALRTCAGSLSFVCQANTQDALSGLFQNVKTPGIALICGSLYLAGDVLKTFPRAQ